MGAQAELFPDWRHHAFATNRTVPMLTADIDHRDHATVELAIRDLKDQALAHFPSGRYAANSAWTVIAALAHNLGRWATQIGQPNRPIQAARARRRHLLADPRPDSPAAAASGHSGCPPAGPGRPTSRPSSPRSARSPAPSLTAPAGHREPQAHPNGTRRSPLPENTPTPRSGANASTPRQAPTPTLATVTPPQPSLDRPVASPTKPIGGFRLTLSGRSHHAKVLVAGSRPGRVVPDVLPRQPRQCDHISRLLGLRDSGSEVRLPDGLVLLGSGVAVCSASIRSMGK